MTRRRGFTLLEMLVATVIMAVAVSGLMSSLSTSMRNAARITEYDRASMMARSKMDELIAQPRLPRQTILEGPGWRAKVTPYEFLPNPQPGFFVLDRIELEVAWMAGAQRKTFTLEGFRRSVLTQEDVAAGALIPR
jgi:general secretion pathway protein I